ncbi:MAG: hypothetical protein ACJ8C4_10940 [Gemmataceae bacterium]
MAGRNRCGLLKTRLGRLGLELLETRDLPSTVMPDLARRKVNGVTPAATSAPTGVSVSSIRSAYGFNGITFGEVVGDGSGQTIAIIDAYDDPKFVSSTNSAFATSDLHKFDLALNIPEPAAPDWFLKVNQSGGTNYPAANTGWSGEIALDVEWVHALAPGAKIMLVEANTSSSTDMYAAVKYARSVPGVSVISMSWGSPEASSDVNNNSVFTTPAGHVAITYVASTGDNGSPGGYPAYSPNVLAVGGTTLTQSGGTYVSEAGWSGSGGGVSTKETRPAYQSSVTQSATKRTIPDVSFDANPNSGVPVYDSYNNGTSAPWSQIGGTSFSAPAWAALIAVTDQGRALSSQSSLNGLTDTLPRLYTLSAADFHDVTSGSNGGFSATTGYDLVTGRGTPYGDRVAIDLVDDSVAPAAAATFTNVTAAGGTSYSFSVTFTDNLALNVSSIDSQDIVIQGPNGFGSGAALQSISGPTNGKRTATYSFAVPGGSWDVADTGSYSVSVVGGQVVDAHGNAIAATTLGSFVFALPPKVQSDVINGGDVQRSRVTSIGVTFDGTPTWPANVASAFQLIRQSDNAAVDLTATVNGSTVTLMFNGALSEFGSLADGRYTLTVFSSAAQNMGVSLDGDNDGVPGGDYVLMGDTATNHLFRLYGDSNGDGSVDQTDYLAFRNAISTNSDIFDFDGLNGVDQADYLQFRNRIGAVV